MKPSNGKGAESGASSQTPFQKFQALAKRVIKVPKATVDQRIRDERAKKRGLKDSK